MGQDSESAAEFVMTVRTDHVAMKTWYTDNQLNDNIIKLLKEKYGNYPSMWKEVLNWQGWKDTRKEYLKYIQTSGNNNNSTNINNIKVENNDNITIEEPRKRKSRWGTTPAVPENNTNINVNNNINNNNDNGNDATKRRSRWGRDEPQQQQQQQQNIQQGMYNNNNNFQQQQVMQQNSLVMPLQSSNNIQSLLLPGILPMSTEQLTPQQQNDMKELQLRLRIINEKMDKLDIEAERIDALPRSNPERSPSPPPSMLNKK